MYSLNRSKNLISSILRQNKINKLTNQNKLNFVKNFENSNKIINKKGFSNNNNNSKFEVATVSNAILRLSESFIDGTSATYVEQMYEGWKRDPNSVHISWASYFQNVEAGAPPGEAYMSPPTLHTPSAKAPAPSSSSYSHTKSSTSPQEILDSLKLVTLIRAYQIRGHMLADLDPLGLTKITRPQDLQIGYYGWNENDLNREITVSSFDKLLPGFFTTNADRIHLKDAIQKLESIYCGKIGVEFMHIQDRERVEWLCNQIENPIPLSQQERSKLLDRLIHADGFEKFLSVKYSQTKRFGLDGCESLIPGMKVLIDESADFGARNIVIGMPHRGRLNVLANVMRKPLDAVLSDFSAASQVEEDGFSGDVKYHLGTTFERPTSQGHRVRLSLLANPSHLEAVDPVVLGKTRARQYLLGDNAEANKSVMAVLLHGDAAFSGQGVVFESFDLAGLENYSTGGTVHIIVNNQIGFTTDPKAGRSWPYCTEVAKSVQAPIFHVNGDDPESVVRAFKIAAAWRQKFHTDVVIDIVCYRRFGHNELDQPSFTQPLMYSKIAKHPSTLEIYKKKLLSENVVTQDYIDDINKSFEKVFNEAFDAAKNYKPTASEWLSSPWQGFKTGKTAIAGAAQKTNVPIETLLQIGAKLTTVPEHFKPHPNLVRLLDAKKKMFETKQNFDWATGEALAFGSLLLENIHVRLSGQDVQRGTFSHRHVVLHDHLTDELYTPLNNLSPNQKKFTVVNSSLSEYAVMGFEYGYSLESPHALILWEAQFGDFSNCAQVIIDQFISCGETKWKCMSGLVLLLPHGYEGQGPEHSSARLERFLQLSDSDPRVVSPILDDWNEQIQDSNLQVLNCTTPANYFHSLRRQIYRDYRKPLIIFSPKSLLKHRLAVSTLDDFVNGEFEMVIDDTEVNLVAKSKIKKLLFCSGKVYYELFEERQKRKAFDVAVVRVEQLAPFPWKQVIDIAKNYPNASVGWLQEEPMNMGAWSFIQPHLKTALKGDRGNIEINYFGRDPAAATATGYSRSHDREKASYFKAALD
eukprot:TRINITY_DN540_c2_g1_i1.p1 TRINITY_DN540_c2_g1~~TRINITY_DN540_c2_g1_i1.p1  ORF type:complete len:1033 (+),score=522.37 TRINITY_DN540_c2_g1_i1:49-3147(+)